MSTKKTGQKSGEIIAEDQMVASREIRSGFLSGPGIHEMPVEYSVVNGLAIHGGCIELGAAELVEAEAERIRAAHLRDATQPAGGDVASSNGEQMGVGLPQTSSYLWTNAVVAYTIASDLPQQARVTDALAHIQARSAVRFVRRTSSNASQFPNYCEFIRNPNANWSSSSIGMRGGRQFIRVSDGAGVGTLVHECLHALGIYHEQSRSDRDSFVDIKWENIDQDFVSNFQKIPGSVDYFDYDFGSIMHYPRVSFSKNGQPTIVPKQSGVSIGQRTALSYGDRQTIAKLYERFFKKGYTGVWRAGAGAYGLWVNAEWASFKSKWDQWNSKGLRLQDIHVRRAGGKTLYSGVWSPGTGGHALWANTSWDSFRSKWEEFNTQGLRLVDMHVHRAGNENRYSGVWLPGGGGYGLWVNASWEAFKSKWEEWNTKGLRLVDIHVHRVGGLTRYSGVWRAGTGGYALWANVTWESFRAKWQQLAAQGLRLADANLHIAGGQTRYTGVWLPGGGGYALWANVTWESFRAKWEELAEKGYRLVDFEIAIPEDGIEADMSDMAGMGDADAALAAPTLEEEPFGGLFNMEPALPIEPPVEVEEEFGVGGTYDLEIPRVSGSEHLGAGAFTLGGATDPEDEPEGEAREVGETVTERSIRPIVTTTTNDIGGGGIGN